MIRIAVFVASQVWEMFIVVASSLADVKFRPCPACGVVIRYSHPRSRVGKEGNTEKWQASRRCRHTHTHTHKVEPGYNGSGLCGTLLIASYIVVPIRSSQLTMTL